MKRSIYGSLDKVNQVLPFQTNGQFLNLIIILIGMCKFILLVEHLFRYNLKCDLGDTFYSWNHVTTCNYERQISIPTCPVPNMEKKQGWTSSIPQKKSGPVETASRHQCRKPRGRSSYEWKKFSYNGCCLWFCWLMDFYSVFCTKENFLQRDKRFSSLSQALNFVNFSNSIFVHRDRH